MPDAMFAAWRTRVEAALDRALPDPATSPERLHAAMRHGVLNGGKRMRPMLVYATGRAFGATELLLRSPQAIKQVAQAVGFASEKSFMRAFRGWTGQSPADFRRQARGSSVERADKG